MGRRKERIILVVDHSVSISATRRRQRQSRRRGRRGRRLCHQPGVGHPSEGAEDERQHDSKVLCSSDSRHDGAYRVEFIRRRSAAV